jgi:MFS family permease
MVKRGAWRTTQPRLDVNFLVLSGYYAALTYMSKSSITRTALRISTIEGSWAIIHFLITSGFYFTGFALLLGANDLELGLLGAIPMLAQVFQMLGAYVIERTGWRKPIVAWFSVVSRATWLPIALIPLFVHSRPVLIFMILYLFSNIAMNIAGSGWVTWMSAIVPAAIRGRYFGMRNRIGTFVSICGYYVAGYVLDLFKRHGEQEAGFMVLQLVAVIAGLMAFSLIRRQHDPGSPPEPVPPLMRYVLQPMRDPNYRRIIALSLYWSFAVGIASPFFGAHLLKNMDWDYQSLSWLNIITSITTIAVLTGWGRMVDRFGHKPVMMICTIGIIQLPFYFAFCPWNVRWPIYANAVMTGVFWSGYGLASFNLLIEMLPQRNRTMSVAVLAALNGIVMFVANTLSGWLADAMEGVHWQFGLLAVVNYQVLFVMTGLLRIPAILFLRRIHEPDAVTMRVLVQRMFGEFNQRVGRNWPLSPGAMKDSGVELPKQE